MSMEEVKLVIDPDTGNVFQEVTRKQQVFVYTEELVKNLAANQIYRIDDFNWGATVFQGTTPVNIVSIHYAPTIRMKGRFILSEDGSHVTAIVRNEQLGDYNPLKGLFLTQFFDGEIHYKPLFIVDRVNPRTKALDLNNEKFSLFFAGRKPEGGIRIVKPPLANIHSDSKICMGNVILYPPNHSGYKKAETCSYHFQSSDTNADLIPAPDTYRAYVKFDLNEKHIPEPGALRSGAVNVGPPKHIVQIIDELFKRRDL